jgi:hypothetical protein
MTEQDPPATVFAAMAKASAAITAVGKSLRNEQAGYAARSIDDVLDAVHEPLAAAGVVLVPQVRTRITEERRSRGDRPLYYVALEVAFTFYGPDGSHVEVVTWGEAMDSQDKATNKAQSAALKMALIQTFTIPVAGDDADRHDPDPVVSEPMASPAQVQALAERLAQLWDRIGRRAHPRAWQETLPSIAYMREHGATVVQVESAERILTEAAANLPTPAEPATDATEATEPAAGTDVCEVCGTGGYQHEEGCANEPF